MPLSLNILLELKSPNVAIVSMKEYNTTPPLSTDASNLPRSRFRPVSLPVYLDSYKGHLAKKRMPRPPVEPAPAPAQRSSPKQPGSGFYLSSSIPRMLRPSNRTSLLSRPRPIALPTPPYIPTSPTSAPASYRPHAYESRCCQMLIHGLYVAFEDDFIASGFGLERKEELCADGGRPFTHFISLSTRHPAAIASPAPAPLKKGLGKANVNGARAPPRRLNLRLPRLYSPTPPTPAELEEKVAAAREAAARHGVTLSQEDYYDILFDEGEGSGVTGLAAAQLLAARDFLFASNLDSDSPHSSNSNLGEGEVESETRVLITTPRDHRTDAIAVAMTYLAIVLNTPVRRILRTQDKLPRVLPIWKGTMSEDCAAFVEQVARL
ncbi:hypothetical protein C8R46DRAFT_1185608 [Mycena filopes]|nr:hypothetical protein C8R46DRAFT_1185608 [Mycena filopes]